MIFKEVYTSKAVKEAVLADSKATIEEKAKENKKIEVTEEAFLSAIMVQTLIDKIEHARASLIK